MLLRYSPVKTLLPLFILMLILMLAAAGCTLVPASFTMPDELDGEAPWRGDIYFLAEELPPYLQHKDVPVLG